MLTFEDLTMAELDELQQVVLGGKLITDDAVDSSLSAAGAMWLLRRRDEPSLDWQRARTSFTLRQVREFAEGSAAENPPSGDAPSS